MILQLFSKKKELTFDRTYAAPIDKVWDAWTKPEILRQWWGPPKTSVTECEIDARVGGRIHVVMEATDAMGKYAGTQWPMSGTFTLVEDQEKLAWDARSWTDGEQDGTTIEHVNELTMTSVGGQTTVHLQITINSIGADAKMAVMGMKMGYSAQLKKLKAHLEG